MKKKAKNKLPPRIMRIIFPGGKQGVSTGSLEIDDLSRDQLEEEVAARTAELTRTIALLKEQINERWTVEQRLSGRNELLQTLIDKIPVMITLYNAEGEFVLCNREFERLVGWTSADLAAMDLMEACYPDPDYREEIWRFMKAAEPGWRDITVTTKLGHRLKSRWANVRLSDGSQIGIGIDISERKAFEQELERRKQVAEKRSEQLRQLALQLSEAEELERRRVATILHDDLQQLLVGIKYQTDILKHQAGDNWVVNESLGVIRDLLGRSITSTRNLSHELNPPVLRQLGLHASLHWLARHMQEMYGLQVEVQAIGDSKVPGRTLRSFVFRTAQELLFNVVKHGETDRAWLTFHPLRSCVVFTVEDHGSGFESRRMKRSGGFGLFSIQERVKLMGGSADISSSPGKGTRVCVTIPYLESEDVDNGDAQASVSPEAARTEGGAGPHPSGDRIRILLVDDHGMMRQGLAMLLENQPDLEIIGQAGDGGEGIEKALRLAPDVVLMDVAMPGVDGIEATRRIKSGLSTIRVLGLSMSDDPAIAEKMIEAGADAFLTKNGPSDRLLDAIRAPASD